MVVWYLIKQTEFIVVQNYNYKDNYKRPWTFETTMPEQCVKWRSAKKLNESQTFPLEKAVTCSLHVGRKSFAGNYDELIVKA
jgi:hypothetical protein